LILRYNERKSDFRVWLLRSINNPRNYCLVAFLLIFLSAGSNRDFLDSSFNKKRKKPKALRTQKHRESKLCTCETSQQQFLTHTASGTAHILATRFLGINKSLHEIVYLYRSIPSSSILKKRNAQIELPQKTMSTHEKC
jgi:hypothetical protein